MPGAREQGPRRCTRTRAREASLAQEPQDTSQGDPLTDAQARMTRTGARPAPPYAPPALSKAVLTAWVPVEHTPSPRRAPLADVEWRLGVAATGLDLPAKRVRLANGPSVAFDRLLIATGTRARPWPNQAEAELEGVFTVHGRDDAKLLRQRLAAKPRPVLVIGGGFTGSQIASDCCELGLPVPLGQRGAAPVGGRA